MDIFNQKGNTLITLILILMLSIIFLLIIYSNNYIKQEIPQTVKDNNTKSEPSPLSESINKRKNYNFDQLLNSFRKITIDEYSIALEIPKQTNFILVSKENNDKKVAEYAIHLESSDSTGTEVYDGMLIKMNIHIKDQESIKNTYGREQSTEDIKLFAEQKITFKEPIALGNNTFTVINHCCYSGITKEYLLSNDKYIFEFDTYTAGPDKENYNKLVEKILNSIKI